MRSFFYISLMKASLSVKWVAQSWKRWKHVSSHLQILAATFGWLGQRPSQPNDNWLAGSKPSQPGRFFQTGCQPNGWKTAKCLLDSLIEAFQVPAKWLRLIKMAGTQPNGWDFIKVFSLQINPSRKRRVKESQKNSFIITFIF